MKRTCFDMHIHTYITLIARHLQSFIGHVYRFIGCKDGYKSHQTYSEIDCLSIMGLAKVVVVSKASSDCLSDMSRLVTFIESMFLDINRITCIPIKDM